MKNNVKRWKQQRLGYASYDVDKYDDYSDSNLQYTSYEKDGSVNRYKYQNLIYIIQSHLNLFLHYVKDLMDNLHFYIQQVLNKLEHSHQD